MRVLVLVCLLCCTGFSADVVQVPTRIGEIEKTFTLNFLETVENQRTHERTWIFMMRLISPFEAIFPVAVPEAADDHDVHIAINAAASCAGWYEKAIIKRKEKK